MDFKMRRGNVMRMWRSGVLGVALLLVAACGSTTPTPSPAAPSAAASSVAAASPGAPSAGTPSASPAVSPSPAEASPSTEPSPSASPSASPSPSPSPSPSGPTTKADYAAIYLPIAAQANKGIKACLASTTAVSNVAAAKKVAGKCITLVAAPVAAFKAVNWGPYASQAAAVSKAIDKLDAYLATMRDAKTVNALVAAYQKTSGALTNLRKAATTLRASLGLPKVAVSSYT